MNVEIYAAKAEFVRRLGRLMAEAGIIAGLDYEAQWDSSRERVIEETIYIEFENGYIKKISVMADSKKAIMMDVLCAVGRVD